MKYIYARKLHLIAINNSIHIYYILGWSVLGTEYRFFFYFLNCEKSTKPLLPGQKSKVSIYVEDVLC
jgi:hypothetical protein